MATIVASSAGSTHSMPLKQRHSGAERRRVEDQALEVGEGGTVDRRPQQAQAGPRGERREAADGEPPVAGRPPAHERRQREQQRRQDRHPRAGSRRNSRRARRPTAREAPEALRRRDGACGRGPYPATHLSSPASCSEDGPSTWRSRRSRCSSRCSSGPGWASSDTKIDLHVDPVGFLGDVASAWSSTGDLGHVQGGQYGGYLFPIGPFFALGAPARRGAVARAAAVAGAGAHAGGVGRGAADGGARRPRAC